MKDIKIAKELALKFRLALESLTDEDLGESTWFSKFPKGCCGDTCDLLSKYFIENGIDTEYVWGMHHAQSHAWLEYMGYIIDITADQFDEIIDKVVVTTNKHWYSKFKVQSRSYRDFDKFNELNKVRLDKLYRAVIYKISQMD